MSTWPLTAVMVTLLVFAGCNRGKAVDPVDSQSLIGTWKLVKSGAYNVTLLIEPAAQPFQSPSVSVFTLSGASSVNYYSSGFSYRAPAQPEIIVSPIVSTRKAGSAEAMQFEQTYFAHLKAVSRCELTGGNRLWFYHPDGVLVYEK